MNWESSRATPSRRPGLLEQHWDNVLLAVVLLPQIWPLLSEGLPRSADGSLHVMRLLALDNYVRQGQWLPRWAPDLAGGFGYPVFNFYSPASYYLAEIPRLLGFDAFTSVAIAFGVMLVAAALGMRSLVRAMWAERISNAGLQWAGLVGAVAYGYAPYLLENVYLRSAIAEAAAQALLPWILWVFFRLITHHQPQRFVLPAVTLLAGLALTHNITLILFPPLLLIFLFTTWWSDGRRIGRALWVIAAGLGAVVLSAFFWAPLIAERGSLSTYAYGLSSSLLIPENIWSLTNFLDLSLAFRYSLTTIPYKIGIVQLALAVVGTVLLVRQSRSWLWWGGIAILYALFAGSWAQPLWMASDILQIIQFPWRVLSVISVVLAILTVGLVVAADRRPGQAMAAGVLVVATVVICHVPQPDQTPLAPAGSTQSLLSSINTFEADTGAWGTGSAHEFMPRWVDDLVLKPETAEAVPPLAAVQVLTASPWSTTLQVDADTPTSLRLTDFYFPGWAATLPDGSELPVRPTTSLGLLTIDIPEGAHTIDVHWGSTLIRSWSERVSLVALVTLIGLGSLWAVRKRANWGWTATLSIVLIVGVIGQWPSTGRDFELKAANVDVVPGSLRLVGLGIERARADALILHPFWLATTRLDDSVFTWTVRRTDGEVVAQIQGRPVYGSRTSSDWSAGTLVDDRYQVGLPGQLEAGDYDVTVAVSPSCCTDLGTVEQTVARVSLDANPNEPSPPADALAMFNNVMELGAAEVTVNGRTIVADPDGLIVLRPNDQLELALPWRPRAAIVQPLKSYVHLVNDLFTAAKSDQTVGTHFFPVSLWNLQEWQRDVHRLRIANDAHSGLYDVMAGLYVIKDATVGDLTLWTLDSTTLPRRGDAAVLFRVKVVGSTTVRLGAPLARLGNVADLLSAEVEVPAATPGSNVRLRLVYRALGGLTTDLKEFVHLYSPELGLAGQVDTTPGAGLNPTSSWQSGEIVVEELVIPVSSEAAPGTYSLLVGYYDPVTGERVYVRTRDGREPPDRTVDVEPIAIAR